MRHKLTPSQLFDDVLYAMSMYFASSLKASLLSYKQDVMVMLLLCATLGLQQYTEHYVTSLGESPFMSIVTESVYIVSRTLAFLILQLTIHFVSAQTATANTYWMEPVVLPVLLLFMGVSVSKMMKV